MYIKKKIKIIEFLIIYIIFIFVIFKVDLLILSNKDFDIMSINRIANFSIIAEKFNEYKASLLKTLRYYCKIKHKWRFLNKCSFWIYPIPISLIEFQLL